MDSKDGVVVCTRLYMCINHRHVILVSCPLSRSAASVACCALHTLPGYINSLYEADAIAASQHPASASVVCDVAVAVWSFPRSLPSPV